jgi:hypothetical protein
MAFVRFDLDANNQKSVQYKKGVKVCVNVLEEKDGSVIRV